MNRTVKAGYLAAAQGYGSCMAIVVASVLSRYLEQEDYATYRQTILTFRFLAPLLLMGLPQASVYFLSRDKIRTRGILIEIQILLISVGILFFLFLILGGNQLVASVLNNPDLSETLIWFAPYALFVLPVSALNTALTACNRPQWAAIFSVITQTIFGAVIILLINNSDSVVTLIKGVIVHSLFISIIALYIFLKISKNTEYSISLIGMKTLLAYSIPLGVGGAVGYLNINLDKIVVARFVNPKDYAIYINGAFEVPLIGMITGAASAIILPDMIRQIKAGNSSVALNLWKRAAVKSATLLFPFTVVLWVWAPQIMITLFGKNYENSAQIFKIYILLVPIRIGFFGVIYQACGKGKLLLRRSLLALTLNLIATVPLTYLMGPVGAACSTVFVSWLIMVPYNSIETSRFLKVKTRDLYAWRPLFKITLSSAALLLSLSCLKLYVSDVLMLELVVQLIIIIPCTLICAVILHLVFGVWKKEDISNACKSLYAKIYNARKNS